jgi:hypothetical protein
MRQATTPAGSVVTLGMPPRKPSAPDVSAEMAAGQALRIARTAAGLTQQQVADRMAGCGYPDWRQTTIAKTEAAQRPLRLNELVALARILGTNPFTNLDGSR